MKTYEKWEESNLDLYLFLGNEPCEIDEGIFLHLLEAVSPYYFDGAFGQCGEAMEMKNGITYRETVQSIENRYFYLGILPQFENN